MPPWIRSELPSCPGLISGTECGNSLNHYSVAYLRSGGHVVAWGSSAHPSGSSGEPTDGNYTAIYQQYYKFAAVKDNGEIYCWGQTGQIGCPRTGRATT